MWTVGLISKECCKTYHYEGFAEAEKEYKYWLGCFKNNNAVESRTTIIERETVLIKSSLLRIPLKWLMTQICTL